MKKLAFADHFKFYVPIQGSQNFIQLEYQLDTVYSWSVCNKMLLNRTKCKIVAFTRKKYTILFTYYFENEPLGRMESIKDLDGKTLEWKIASPAIAR